MARVLTPEETAQRLYGIAASIDPARPVWDDLPPQVRTYWTGVIGEAIAQDVISPGFMEDGYHPRGEDD